jgi:hypothetical protein
VAFPAFAHDASAKPLALALTPLYKMLTRFQTYSRMEYLKRHQRKRAWSREAKHAITPDTL